MLRRTPPSLNNSQVLRRLAFATSAVAPLSSSLFLQQQSENVSTYFKSIKLFNPIPQISNESLQKLMKEKGFILKNSDKNNNNSNNNSKDKKNENEEPEQNENNDGDSSDKKTDDNVQSFLRGVTIGVASVTALALAAWYMSYPGGKHVSWKELQIVADKLESIKVYDQYAQVTLEDEKAFVGVRPTMTGHTDQEVRELIAKRPKDSDVVAVTYVGTSVGERFLHFIEVWSFVAPFLFFPLFTLVVSRAAASIVYDNAKLSSAMGSRREQILTQAGEQFQIATKTTTRFRDIAGMTEAKAEIVEIVDFLKFPDKFTRMGAKIPAGALLLGPPGTGKTMLARAVAGESQTPFIATCGSDFVELYAGMGALRVRKLFELARTQPKCIIYIDEIDAIGSKRTGSGMGEQSEQEHTLNELLTQLDGFNKEKDRIIILASTNADKDQLDSALTRPGRFDRMVNVESPVLKERLELFETYLKGIKLMEQPKDVEEIKIENNTTTTSTTSASGTDGNTTDSSSNKTQVEEKTDNDNKSNENNNQKKSEAPVDLVLEPAAVAATTVLPSVSVTKNETTEEITTKIVTPNKTSDAVPPVTSQPQEQRQTPSPPPTTPPTETQPAPLSIHATGGDTNNNAATLPPAAENDDDDKARQKSYPNKPTPEFMALVHQYAARMADLCPGFVGADIASVCNEAAILAAREKSGIVTLDHLERSVDRVLAGIEHRSRVLSDFEKKVVAHHEAGHAVAGWFLGRADPLMKVSIVPRGGKALGYAQYLPNENQLRTSAEIEDSICVTLGGRVAEKIFFDHLSTGASDDLQKIRRMAYMHASTFNRATAVVSPGTSQTRYLKPYGEATEEAIDVAAKQLVDRLYQRTYDLLLKHKGLMEQLAEHLMKNEVLTHTDILHYMGPRAARPSDNAKVF